LPYVIHAPDLLLLVYPMNKPHRSRRPPDPHRLYLTSLSQDVNPPENSPEFSSRIFEIFGSGSEVGNQVLNIRVYFGFSV